MKRLVARRGIALIAALTLITLLGIVVAALVASSIAAQRATRLGHSGATALASAEFGVSTVLGDPVGYQLATLPLGRTRSFLVTAMQTSGVRVDVAVTRLPRGVLWLVGAAAVLGIDSSERRVNLVAQFPNVAPLPPAPIVSRGGVDLADDVSVELDTTGDVDCAARGAGPMVVTAPGATVVVAPGIRVEAQPAASDSNSYLLTVRQRSMLGSAAGVRHVTGDTTISGGSFDGILLVDGALTVSGPFVLNGVVVATGPIRATAGGFVVTGALMSSYSGPGHAVELAGAALRFQPCKVATALRFVAPPRRILDRSWAELF